MKDIRSMFGSVTVLISINISEPPEGDKVSKTQTAWIGYWLFISDNTSDSETLMKHLLMQNAVIYVIKERLSPFSLTSEKLYKFKTRWEYWPKKSM